VQNLGIGATGLKLKDSVLYIFFLENFNLKKIKPVQKQ
jgi:hypothetical protein